MKAEKYILSIYIVYYLLLPLAARHYGNAECFGWYAMVPPVLALLYFLYCAYSHYRRGESFWRSASVSVISAVVTVLNYYLYVG